MREGELLKRKTETLGIGLALSGGNVPDIRFHAHGGAQVTLRWNGRNFARQ